MLPLPSRKTPASTLTAGAIGLLTVALALTVIPAPVEAGNCPGTPGYDPSGFEGTQCFSSVAIHAKAHTTKSTTTCTTWTPLADGLDCYSYNPHRDLNQSSDVYLMVAQVPHPSLGIAGMSCGIVYNQGRPNRIYCGDPQSTPSNDGVGVDVFGWTFCATALEFTNGCDLNNAATEWPESGGGNRITWDYVTGCAQSTIGGQIYAPAGAFYLYAYSDDLFQVTPNNNLLSGPGEFQVADCSLAVSDLVYPVAAGQAGFGTSSYGYTGCLDTPVKATTWGKIKTQY